MTGNGKALRRVYEPIRIGPVEVPNRIVVAAHGTALSRPHLTIGGEDFIAYHVARARGGVGLSVLEAMAVHPTCHAMTLSGDHVIERYREIMDALRPHGTRVFQQLLHMGPIRADTPAGAVPWAVSSVPSLTGVVGDPVTVEQIDEVVAAFGAAARRCRDGGLDGVELHAAHGTLPHAFLSELYNTRTDGYGGGLEHRMRFIQEILRAMRQAAGDDFVVGVRLGPSEMPGSVTEDDLVSVVEALQREGLIDYLITSVGDFFRVGAITGGMEYPPGYQLATTTRLAAAAAVPSIVVGRFGTLAEAEQVLADGVADMVSLVRAHIADPDIVRKTRAGRAAEVRPCIACNACMALQGGTQLSCAVNPVAGRERTLSEDGLPAAAVPRRVLVVGGGPAGLEAARVAARSGHDVTLVEASPVLGGALDAARRAPRYGIFDDFLGWLTGEVERAGVAVELGTCLSADDVRRRDADVVIVATGSTPRLDGFQPQRPFEPARGVEQPHVRSSIQLLTAGVPEGARTALVLDTVGHFEAIAAAEHVVQRGLALTFVTSLPSFGGPAVQASGRQASALELLYGGAFTLLVRHHLAAITPSACHVRPLYTEATTEVPADVVVLVTQNTPVRGIYDALRAGGEQEVILVGDAASPRDLTTAMAEGHRAARALSSAIPTAA